MKNYVAKKEAEYFKETISKMCVHTEQLTTENDKLKNENQLQLSRIVQLEDELVLANDKFHVYSDQLHENALGKRIDIRTTF